VTEGAGAAARSASSRALLAGALAIVAVVLLVYLSALDAPFTFDDENNITQNPGIRWGSLRLWSPTARPVANGSFALSHAWFGLDVRGYRAVNVGIHGLASLAVMMLGAQWSRSFDARGRLSAAGHAGVGVVAGLVFASHPLATQSVTYVVQRMTSLSTLFYVGALWLWIASAGWTSRGRAWGRWGSVFVWVLGMGTKEIAATWPVVVWLWEWGYGRGRGRGGEFVRRTWWMWAVALLGGGLALWGYGAGDPFGEYARKPFTLGERLWTEPRVWWRYVGLWLWPDPSRLSVIHGVEMSRGAFAPWTTGLSWVSWLVAGVAGAVAWRRESSRWVGFAVGWYLVQQAVEGTVLPLEPMYEHRTYLPSVGLSIGLSYGAAQLLQRGDARVRGLGLAVAAAGIAALAFAAHARNQVWRSPEALWSDALAKAPSHPRPHTNYGMALAGAGDHEAAVRAYRRAAELEPGFQEAWHNQGVSLAALGRDAEARAAFERAIELEPRDVYALRGLASVLIRAGELDAGADVLARAARVGGGPALYAQLAHARAQQGRLDEAVRWLAVALSMDRSRADYHALFADLSVLRGDFARAAEHLDESLSLRDDARARAARAWVHWVLGEWPAAIEAAELAAKRSPRSARAASTLAWMRATSPDAGLRDPARALSVARDAGVERDPRLRAALALALAQLGDRDAAIVELERAIDEATAGGLAKQADAWRALLADIRQRRVPLDDPAAARRRVVADVESRIAARDRVPEAPREAGASAVGSASRDAR